MGFIIVSATRRRRDFNIVSKNHGRTQKKSVLCITDHHTPNTIHGFRDSILVCNMHDFNDTQKFRAFPFLPIK